MELYDKFQKTLLVLRNRSDIKLTQEDIADEAGMTLRYYQKLESGESKKPSLEIVDKIARAFDMKLSEFCKFMEEID
ncbi:MAG: helix-turn-helix transcriptional regulator [Bacteroidales bacterium]|nr:helix-turn-helix transcriptional regulator [Bacteroidales bacterium]